MLTVYIRESQRPFSDLAFIDAITCVKNLSNIRLFFCTHFTFFIDNIRPILYNIHIESTGSPSF